MKEASELEIYGEPIESTLDDLIATDINVFFATVIVNPFGPTLTVMAAVGVHRIGNTVPVVMITLNPFNQSVEQIGRFRYGETWVPSQIIERLLPFLSGSCPSLIFVNSEFGPANRRQCLEQLFASFGSEVVAVAARVERHLGDPWARVSEEMAGEGAQGGSMEVEAAVSYLTDQSLSVEHVKPEFQALLYAWQGSIEETGLSPAISEKAWPLEQFRTFLIERLMLSLWLPEVDSTEDVPQSDPSPERLEVGSLAELSELFESERWKSFSPATLVQLLRLLLHCYGTSSDTSFIGKISAVYEYALVNGLDEASRLRLEEEMVALVENGEVSPVVFLPFLVFDECVPITTKAAIDFVSCSDYIDGELYAFKEIRELFGRGTLANRGAVFGALLSIGDEEVIQFLEPLRAQLTLDEFADAANVHTEFPQHRMIQFWLGLARDTLNSAESDEQRTFGICASALARVPSREGVQRVFAGKRNFPCHLAEEPITVEQTWSLDEYAECLAPDLYALEAAEASPKVFSEVLRSWGLEPGAVLLDQFIPSEGVRGSLDKALRDLNPSKMGIKPQSLVSRIFGKRP
jgi:hypothetical protein